MNDNFYLAASIRVRPQKDIMIYQIDSKVAQEVGFVGAILFHHICFWIKKNKANQNHFHDGEYWTYSSVKGFAEYFEDLSERQIKQGLLNLKEKGFLKCGNFNKNPYDKTNWYALDKKGYSIKQSCSLDETKLSNRETESVRPIPDIITDNNNIYKIENIKERKFVPPTLEQVQNYCKAHNFTATDPMDFWEFYGSKGWRVGNTPMKKWELALSRWERNNKNKGRNNGINFRNNQKDTSNNNGSCNDPNDYAGIRC